MKIEYTKNVPQTFPFKNIAIGDVFFFDDDEDVLLKFPK